MLTEEQGKQLHSRAVRGENITPVERSELEKWYAWQDQQEHLAIHSTVAENSVEQLQAQIEEVLIQLSAATSRIQELVRENENLRREISLLRRQLANSLALQPA